MLLLQRYCVEHNLLTARQFHERYDFQAPLICLPVGEGPAQRLRLSSELGMVLSVAVGLAAIRAECLSRFILQAAPSVL